MPPHVNLTYLPSQPEIVAPEHFQNLEEQGPSELSAQTDDDVDEDEVALARAVAESLRTWTPNRYTANGTNLDDLALAIQNSTLET